MNPKKKTEINEYEKQALDFCKKYNVDYRYRFSHQEIREFGDSSRRYPQDVYICTLSRVKGETFSFKYYQSAMGSSWDGLDAESVGRLVKPMGGATLHDVEMARRKHARGTAPTAYELLSCLQKNDPGLFDDFCQEMGYSNDSIKAHKVYLDCQKEWAKVRSLFSDCMEELQEIC